MTLLSNKVKFLDHSKIKLKINNKIRTQHFFKLLEGFKPSPKRPLNQEGNKITITYLETDNYERTTGPNYLCIQSSIYILT